MTPKEVSTEFNRPPLRERGKPRVSTIQLEEPNGSLRVFEFSGFHRGSGPISEIKIRYSSKDGKKISLTETEIDQTGRKISWFEETWDPRTQKRTSLEKREYNSENGWLISRVREEWDPETEDSTFFIKEKWDLKAGTLIFQRRDRYLKTGVKVSVEKKFDANTSHLVSRRIKFLSKQK